MKERIVIGTEQCRAEIAHMGAQLESLKDADGREYMWQRDPQWWGGCAPVLFPMVGALRKAARSSTDASTKCRSMEWLAAANFPFSPIRRRKRYFLCVRMS